MFDSFDFQAFKEFIIQDEQKIANKIFYGMKGLVKRTICVISLIRFWLTDIKINNFFEHPASTKIFAAVQVCSKAICALKYKEVCLSRLNTNNN